MTSAGSTAPAGAGEDLLRQHRGETVLITGASSGIGRELARQFAGDGADLVLIARSEDTLRELAGELAADYGVTAQVVPADLSRPGSPDQIVETLAQRQTDVDVLVNNAGFGARGPVAGIGVGRQLEMIEVNVAALTRLTALLLPGMLERRRGDLECRLHGRVPAGPELGRVLRDEGVRAVVHRGPGRGSPWLGSAGFVPGPGSDGHRVRGAGRRGGQPAVPAGRDGRRPRCQGRARWLAAG
jgi:NAD(P)-dependent dehydrogenase (short-subunit alcohol dehydrogenase family)